MRGSVVAAATALTVGALALPAAADEHKCGYWRFSSNEQEYYQVCTWESATHVMYGTFEFHNNYSVSRRVTGTVILQKCQAGGVNCVTQAAHSLDVTAPANGGFVFFTAERAGVYGYTYRTCVSADSTSGWSFVFSCSATNPYTP